MTVRPVTGVILAIVSAALSGWAFGQDTRPVEDRLGKRLRPPEWARDRWWQGDLGIWREGDTRYRGWQDLASYSLSFGEVLDLSSEQSMLEFRRLKDAGVRVLEYMTLYHHPDARNRVKEGWWDADHPGWYAVDDQGNFKDTTFFQFRPGWLQTCVNQPGFVADVLRHVAAVMEAGADGVFVDHVAAMSRCYGPETKKHSHRVGRSAAGVHVPVGRVEQEQAGLLGAEWEGSLRDSDPTANAALVALLADIRRVIREVQPEAVLAVNARDITAVPPEMWAVVDMVLFEGFVTTAKPLGGQTPGSRWLPWSFWYESMLQCQPFFQQGKRVIAYSEFGRQGGETLKADSFYAYCTAKLFDAIWGRVNADDLRKVFAAKLGRPVLDRPMRRDGVYYREFDNGIVVVNPAKEAIPFTWREPRGRRVFDHYADLELTGGAELTVEIPAEAGRLFEYEALAGPGKKQP